MRAALLRVLALFLLAFAPGSVLAQEEPCVQYKFTELGGMVGDGKWHQGTAEAYCSKTSGLSQPGIPRYFLPGTVYSAGSGQCIAPAYSAPGGGGTFLGNLIIPGSVRACPPEPGCAGNAGKPGPAFTLYGADRSKTSHSGCMGGCVLSGGSDTCVGLGDPTSWQCVVNAPKFEGRSCTTEPDIKTSPDTGSDTTTAGVDKPPPGKCPGQVNGVTVYVPCDSSSTRDVSTETTPNGDGTTEITTSRDTVCSGGVCTTTVNRTVSTSSNPEVAPTVTTGSSTVVEPEADFCKNNKSHNLCRDESESRFSGTCQTNFTCDGDAATCAVARASNETNCQLRGTGTPSIGESLANGGNGGVTDPKTTAGGARNFTLSPMQSVENPYSESCPANQSIQLSGFSFVLPLGDHCDVLKTLGLVFQAATLFAAVIFVIRGFS